MSLVLHILRKDLRHLWALALAGVIFSLLSTLGWYWDLWPHSSGLATFIGSQIAPMVILFILSVAVVQSDPTVGDRAFWRTRPISPGALFAAKVLFLLLVFALPSLLVNLFLAVSLDAPFPVLLGMVIESTGMIFVECVVSALAGALTASLMQAAAAMLAAALILLIVASSVALPPIFVPWRMDLPDHAPRMAAIGLFGGIAALILIAHQICTRRTARSVVLLAVLMPVVLFSAGQWPVSIKSASLEAIDPSAGPGSSTGVQLMLMTPAVTWSYGWVNDPVTGRAVRAHTVAMSAAIRSIPEGRIIQVESVTSRVHFPDGEELAPQPTGKEYWPFYSSFAQAEAVCRELGLVAPTHFKEPNGRSLLRLFSVANEKAVAVAGKRGTLTATLKLYELAFREVAGVPARPGARWVRDGQAWKIRSLTVDKGVVDAGLQHLRATSILITHGSARPDYRADGYRYGFALINRKRGEFALSSYRWGSSDNPQWTVDINNRDVTFNQLWKIGGAPVDGPLDESWLADAELEIMSAVPVGTFDKQVTLANFEIPQVEELPEAESGPYWQ